MNPSNNIELITYFLKKEYNRNIFECCICCENTKIFYTFCKPECICYSYCKKCVERIAYERGKCPFTNVIISNYDICLDYRKNKEIEKQEKIQEKVNVFLKNKIIKNISIKIDIS
jgi:hypothetical protein